MALQKQVIPAPFDKGVDTKTSPFLTTSFLSLQNCFQQKTGSIQKRFGLDNLSTNISNQTAKITQGKTLFTYNDELLMHDGNILYSYSQPNDEWIVVNELYTNRVVASPVIANSYNQTIPDRDVTNGIELYAWEDSRGGVYVTALDATSGNIILVEQQLSSSYTRPRVVACGTFIFVLAIKSGTSLVSVRFDTENPTGFSSETVISSSINGIYDVITYSSNMIFAYGNASNQLVLGYLTQNNTVGSPTSGLPSPVTFTGITIVNCLSLCGDSNFQHIFCAYSASSSTVKHSAYNINLTTYLSETTLDSGLTTVPSQITLVDNNGVIEVLYELPASSNINYFIKTNSLTISTNAPGTAATLLLSVGLLSKIFLAQGEYYVAVNYDTNIQATNFIIRISDAFIVAKFSYTLGAGILAKTNSLCRASVSTNGLVEFPASRRVKVIAGTSLTFLLGIYKYDFNFNLTSDIEAEQLGQNLHINGGIIQAYDGFGTTELGFLLNPEQPTSVGGSGGLNGTYQYTVVWQWIDQSGQLHQSAPSPIVTSIAVNAEITLTIPTLRLTFKQARYNRTNVMAVIYRTLANSTIFYRLTNLSSPLYNDPTVNTITYTDNAADNTINSNELLYTIGGALPYFPPPASTLSHAFQNRLWLAGAEDANTLYYSNEFITGDGVSFTPTGNILVNEVGGPISALSDIDDKLIIFKNKAVYAIAGIGPDNTGGNGSFSLPQIISGEIGCTEPRAIAKIPDGLMFLSNKGIYLLNRALTFEYIGAPVEAFNNYTFTGAVVVGDENQARFTTLQGTTLVYDWFFQKWYTFTNQQADSCKIWDGNFTILGTNGVTRVEDQTLFSDNSYPINTSVQTGWFSFAGVQGFQRVYSVLLLGKFIGNHVLQVSSFFDFKTTARETVTITPQNVIFGSIYGENNVYGTNGTYGTQQYTDGVYQFEYKFCQQKCESLQLMIQDIFPNNQPSGGFELHAMSFTVGLKNGQYKTVAVRRMT